MKNLKLKDQNTKMVSKYIHKIGCDATPLNNYYSITNILNVK